MWVYASCRNCRLDYTSSCVHPICGHTHRAETLQARLHVTMCCGPTHRAETLQARLHVIMCSPYYVGIRILQKLQAGLHVIMCSPYYISLGIVLKVYRLDCTLHCTHPVVWAYVSYWWLVAAFARWGQDELTIHRKTVQFGCPLPPPIATATLFTSQWSREHLACHKVTWSTCFHPVPRSSIGGAPTLLLSRDFMWWWLDNVKFPSTVLR
jgi:hypothetical protein